MKMTEQVNQEYQGDIFKSQEVSRRFLNQSMLNLQNKNPILDQLESEGENSKKSLNIVNR